MQPDVVVIQKLTKLYQQGDVEVRALNGVSLTIAEREFLSLMGPSGSGKSTLLHIIAGIDRPTSGTCTVQGVQVNDLNESQLADWRNQNVGFVFQTFNLIPVLTSFENVELPLLLMDPRRGFILPHVALHLHRHRCQQAESRGEPRRAAAGVGAGDGHLVLEQRIGQAQRHGERIVHAHAESCEAARRRVVRLAGVGLRIERAGFEFHRHPVRRDLATVWPAASVAKRHSTVRAASTFDTAGMSVRVFCA